ncbi:MAG: polysaccharide biosynthesis protein [Bacteroidales bacterium]|nr:polysaccharide biosynthesis protein [Bacteroidales bacterium]
MKKYANNTLSHALVYLLDIFFVLMGFVLSAILFRSSSHVSGFSYHWEYVLLLLANFTFSFYLFHTYKGVLRYSGLSDVGRVFFCTAFALLIQCALCWLVGMLNPEVAVSYFPSYAEMVSEVLFAFCFLLLFRLFVRLMFWQYSEQLHPEKQVVEREQAVIFGAGSGGLLTYNLISEDVEGRYRIVAFMDDNFKKAGSYIHGIPVLLPSKVMNREYVLKHGVSTLIIAIPSLSVGMKNKLAEQAMELGLKVKIIPHVYELVEGHMQADQIKDIQIEDLLGRDPIVLENEAVSKEIRGKVVLVTGAAGSIGSEIVRQVMNYEPAGLVLVDDGESPIYDIQFELKTLYPELFDRASFEVADVRDGARMDAVFARYRPELVFHAAAYKHVPLMEDAPYEAVKANVFGTKQVADMCIRYNVGKMVMISTDKAVNPTNVMGATKRIAEIYVQSRHSATQFITTRFGNVLGSNGSVIPLFRKQLEQGGPLTVTDRRIIRYFMTIPEACNLVLQAVTIGKGGEIYVFDMGEPVKIYDMACKMIQLSGKQGIEIREVGLRPGEKLYEELLSNKENTLPTIHNKILHAQIRPQDPEAVDAAFQTLYDALCSMDEMAIVAQMKAIVPEFRSNNSRFAVLDSENTPPIHPRKPGKNPINPFHNEIS